MQVFKFGGASVSTAERIKNVAEILRQYQHQQLLIVVSAIGKTTNALEKVIAAFYNNDKEEALRLFEGIKQEHVAIAQQLINKPIAQLSDFFTEVEWLLHDKPVKSYNYYYDQVVCVGELLSTAIVSAYLNTVGIANQWVDVRDIIRTDNNFRNASIDWEVSAEKTHHTILPIYKETNIVLTQGFIGATDENESTTLGREGSDYTAAVFANLLNAECQIIWKDVQGIMNADPKHYPQAQWIKELSYREVIEMAYYGAQVVHPKTIKPLQNKGIPLLVKSFLHPAEEGTIIHDKSIHHLPPIIVNKAEQVLLQLTSKEFSFVSEGLITDIYQLFETLKFQPNLTQNAAISLLCVVDNIPEKIKSFTQQASAKFHIQVQKDLKLLTIRHYNESILNELIGNQKIILKQQTPETIQVLLQV